MRVAIIGAGNVGVTLGKALAAKGHEMTYGSRSQGAPPHAGAKVASVRDAVAASEVALLTTPWAGAADAVAAAGDFGGKPLLDVTNPVGPGFALTHGHTTSGAEHLASIAKDARVVKAFNTTGLENMAEPRYGAHRLVMPVAGDDPAARGVAAALAADLGFEAVQLPALSRACELEPLALLWIKLALVLGHGRGVGFGLVRRTGREAPETRRAASPRVITIAGTGNIGGALAQAWLRAGHDVRLAVRDPGAADLAPLRAAGAKVLPVAGAGEGADVVVLAVPAGAAREVALSLGDLSGKVVIDITNAIGKGFTLVHGHTTSSSEELAKGLPGARVVRAFNQQGAETLVGPLFGDVRATNFVAGDDEAARKLVLALSDDVGQESIDVGPLSMSRLLEPMTVLWVSMAQALGARDFGLALLRRG